MIEESLHLLRTTPLPVIALYYVGTLPFVIGFLYFWADMSRSAFAATRAASSAFAIAALFIWMKVWHTIFAQVLRQRLSGADDTKWSLSRILNVVIIQASLQPIGLIALALSSLIVFPFGWTYAFFQNVTILGDGQTPEIKKVFGQSAQQSRVEARQNHGILVAMGAFGFFVWLNVFLAMIQVPNLMKMFLGVETAFTRAGYSAIMNTTFWAVSFAIAYLCVDPLMKALYVLRCFYGKSLKSGEDLRVDLRRVTTGIAAVILFITTFLAPIHGYAAEKVENNVAVQSSVPTDDLDQSIKRTISQREYSWRLPREREVKPTEEPKGMFGQFMEQLGETIQNWGRTVRDWIRSALNAIEKLFKRAHPEEARDRNSSDSWVTTLQVFVFILLALVASALAILFYRMWKRRGAREKFIHAQAVQAAPDLSDESVAANELPEDGWLKLAREMMEKGDLRLALRALYLASLAHLAHREMVTIARYKSNRDYEFELRRRARSLPDLQSAFTQNVNIFDRVWYGMHDVTQDALQNFQINMERIRSC